MSYKEIIDNVSNIENLDNTTILKTLEKFAKTIKDFAIEQSGLNNLVNVEFEPNQNAVTYTNGVVDYLGNLKITLADNIIVNKPCSVKFNIKGSNTIVVDVDEFNNSLELHLDNETINKINRALLTPVNAPTEDEFVVVGTNNRQKMIESSKIEKTENKIQYMSQTYNTDGITKYPCLDILNNTYKGLDTFVSRTFESQESALDWIKNNAPEGVYNKVFLINGQIKAYIIQKVSSAYGCILIFSYNSENIILKRLFAGEWQPDRVI